VADYVKRGMFNISTIILSVPFHVTMSYLSNPSTLIKALKAPRDPPQEGWPDKADITIAAWNASDFLLPNKAEILTGHILDTWNRS
jgi:hypothetical protein